VDQNGEGICASMPKYGNGDEPGNEAGYIVGMSSCYPADPVKVSYGETLTLESNYSNAVGHTGVMGLFYILVAQQLPEPDSSLPNKQHFEVITPPGTRTRLRSNRLRYIYSVLPCDYLTDVNISHFLVGTCEKLELFSHFCSDGSCGCCGFNSRRDIPETETGRWLPIT